MITRRVVVLLLLAIACSGNAKPDRASVEPTRPAPPSEPPRTRTASGLELVVERGGGPSARPTIEDRVVVHYDARDPGGAWTRRTDPDDPETFAMRELPAGWTEALIDMSPGDRATLWVPEALGVRDGPMPLAVSPRGAQIVELLLVDVLRGPAPEQLPLSAPPAHATTTASGLAYVRIVGGGGSQHPNAQDLVTAHYTGWTTDGKQFDSSYERGTPIRFRSSQVIPGWREALALMVVGDKLRVWIPEALAYRGQAGRPKGMLVFDIELLTIDGDEPIER